VVTGRAATALLLWLALACPAPAAAEYSAGAFERDDCYVKEACRTKLTYIEGRAEPGRFVKRDRHQKFHQWHYLGGRWWLIFRFRYPPDELYHGKQIRVPIDVRVIRAGDDPLVIHATARVEGIRSPARVKVVPAAAGRRVRGGPIETTPGEVLLTPRLDWDDRWIVLRFSYGDAVGTEFTVGEFCFRPSRSEPPVRPRGRLRDPPPP
jgi:hypothetical protein